MRAPALLGRYELHGRIAAGGMAEIFKARLAGPHGYQKWFAIKRLLPHLADDEEYVRMFLNEANVTALFNHPNLPQVFELQEDQQDELFMVMELIDGIHLQALLDHLKAQSKRASVRLVCGVVLQLLDALDHLHTIDDGKPLGLVHRDLSPHNVLLSPNGMVKLIDFGLVRGKRIDSGTQAGVLKGKMAYLSPEQAQLLPLDARSDIFSLGLCFYELLAGQRAFLGPEIVALKALIDQEPIPLAQLLPECPGAICEVVHRALNKDPRRRFQSARAFKIALQSAAYQTVGPVDADVVAGELTALFPRAGAKNRSAVWASSRALPFTENPSAPEKTETTETPTATEDILQAPRAEGRGRNIKRMLLGFFISLAFGGLVGWATLALLTGEAPTMRTQTAQIFATADLAYHFGDLALKEGDSHQAISALEQAVWMQPNHAQAQRRLADAYLSQGRIKEAADRYRRYLALKPSAADSEKLKRMLENL